MPAFSTGGGWGVRGKDVFEEKNIMNRKFLGLLFTGVLLSCSPAYAELGIDWVKYEGNPVLTLGAYRSWESDHVHNPVVVKEGSTYKMWYDGYDGQRSRTGYATSTDGINWTKYSGNPVISSELGNGAIGTIILDGSTYKAWAELGADVGYWISSDGIIWTPYAGNPVLTHGTGWESVAISDPMVIKDGSVYKMWYQGGEPGSQHRIGYATSPDGINWTKYAGNPIFIPVALGTWAINPFIMKEGSLYKMWYGDADVSPGGNIRIFYATSTDGINWNRYYSANPVVINGGFDGQHALAPWIINDNGDYKMWYTGQNNGQMKIGYAISYFIPKVKDADSDGFDNTRDCNDNNATIYPGSTEHFLSEGIIYGLNMTADDCTIINVSSIYADCQNPSPKNHGQYVSCVAHAANVLLGEGQIDDNIHSLVVSTAAKSDIGKPRK